MDGIDFAPSIARCRRPRRNARCSTSSVEPWGPVADLLGAISGAVLNSLNHLHHEFRHVILLDLASNTSERFGWVSKLYLQLSPWSLEIDRLNFSTDGGLKNARRSGKRRYRTSKSQREMNSTQHGTLDQTNHQHEPLCLNSIPSLQVILGQDL